MNIFCRNVKNDRFVSIRFVFSSSKICQNSFYAGALPPTPLGEFTMLPRPSNWLGRGTPPLHSLPPSTPSASRSRRFDPSVVWPPTSLKFVHLALRSKRLNTPGLDETTLWRRNTYLALKDVKKHFQVSRAASEVFTHSDVVLSSTVHRLQYIMTLQTNKPLPWLKITTNSFT